MILFCIISTSVFDMITLYHMRNSLSLPIGTILPLFDKKFEAGELDGIFTEKRRNAGCGIVPTRCIIKANTAMRGSDHP